MGIFISKNSENEYYKQLENLLKEQEDIINNIDEYTKEIETANNEYSKYIEEITNKRIEEAEKTKNRIKELTDEELTIVKAVSIICALFHNYPFGLQYTSNDWEINMNNTISQIDENVYLLLFHWNLLQPLLLPVDIIITEYSELVSYIENNLNEVIENLKCVCRANCYLLNESIDCIDIINNSPKTTTEFINYITNNFSKNILNNSQLFNALTQRRFNKDTVTMLPSCYPLYDKISSIKCALTIISNCLINRYGRCLTSDGEQLMAINDKIVTEPTIKGGQCYLITLPNCPTSTYWDEIFVNVNNIKIQTFSNSFELNDELEIYYNSNTDKSLQLNGMVRYVNPSKWITKILCYDTDEFVISSTIDRLSAELLGSNFIETLFNTLNDSENIGYNSYNTNNSHLFTVFDYIVQTPYSLDDYQTESGVSPVSKFVYEVLISNSTKWNLIIPLITENSLVSINTIIGTNNKLSSIFENNKLTSIESDAVSNHVPKYSLHMSNSSLINVINELVNSKYFILDSIVLNPKYTYNVYNNRESLDKTIVIQIISHLFETIDNIVEKIINNNSKTLTKSLTNNDKASLIENDVKSLFCNSNGIIYDYARYTLLLEGIASAVLGYDLNSFRASYFHKNGEIINKDNKEYIPPNETVSSKSMVKNDINTEIFSNESPKYTESDIVISFESCGDYVETVNDKFATSSNREQPSTEYGFRELSNSEFVKIGVEDLPLCIGPDTLQGEVQLEIKDGKLKKKTYIKTPTYVNGFNPNNIQRPTIKL